MTFIERIVARVRLRGSRFTDADLDTAIREGWDEGALPLGSDSRPRPLTRSLPLATSPRTAGRGNRGAVAAWFITPL